MQQIHLLASLPRAKRNLQKRQQAQSPENIALARQYGEIYFDGPRELGYGGYRYDGRWMSVARDIIALFALAPGDRILDIGCAKGFLVHDLMTVCPGLEAFGLDISEYALSNCLPAVVGRLSLGNCVNLPFPDRSFQAVISLNTIHNLERADAIKAVREMERLAPGQCFIQVDSYRTPAEKAIFESWVLTAKFHDYPAGWLNVFEEAGYTGGYDWTIVE